MVVARQHFCVGATDMTLRGLNMRNRIVVALALVAALFAGHGAFAFQEQKGSTPAPAEAAPAPAEAAPGDKAGLTDETAPKPEAGTEIRIPGLGKLGVLPKMDFGLELLYGAAENQPAGEPVPAANPEEDLTVRGSVKHRF
jgi:hypothetical protein